MIALYLLLVYAVPVWEPVRRYAGHAVEVNQSGGQHKHVEDGVTLKLNRKTQHMTIKLRDFETENETKTLDNGTTVQLTWDWCDTILICHKLKLLNQVLKNGSEFGTTTQQ